MLLIWDTLRGANIERLVKERQRMKPFFFIGWKSLSQFLPLNMCKIKFNKSTRKRPKHHLDIAPGRI